MLKRPGWQRSETAAATTMHGRGGGVKLREGDQDHHGLPTIQTNTLLHPCCCHIEEFNKEEEEIGCVIPRAGVHAT